MSKFCFAILLPPCPSLPQVAQVERLNAELIAAQKALHDDLVEEIQQRNQERLLAAREAYEAAHDAWIKVRPSRGQVFIQYLDPCIYKCTAYTCDAIPGLMS